MRTELNPLEKLSDHRIVCRKDVEITAVFKDLDSKGYVWPGPRPLMSGGIRRAPLTLFLYNGKIPGRENTERGKHVLQSGSDFEITPENQIVTAAQWLRGNRYFDGLDCTVPEDET
jgi:hypothetical protein